MSAYKEKMLAELEYRSLEREIKETEDLLVYLTRCLKEADERLAEAERDVKWEAENDR